MISVFAQNAETAVFPVRRCSFARAAVWAAVASVLAWCASATAQAGVEGAAISSKPVILITGSNPDDMTIRAADAIVSQLTDLPVEFRMVSLHEWPADVPGRVEWARRIAAQSRATSVFWLDLYGSQQVFLYIADPSGGRILVRTVVEESGPEARLETIAVIVRGAMKAILAGGRIGVEVPVAPLAREARQDRLDAFASYAMQLYSPDRPLLHGARLGLSTTAFDWFKVTVAYRLVLPLRVETALVAVDLRPHPVELALGARLGKRKWRLEMSVGLVVDFATIDATSLNDRFEAVDPEREWIVSVSPGVELGRAVGPVAVLYAAVSLDVALLNHRYVVDTGEEKAVVLAPWRLRPLFQLGARFALL